MAELFPDEGIDEVLGVFPKGGVTFPTLYLGLFTSQSATTVPGASAVLATQTGVTEASGTGYARTPIDANEWGAIASGGGGRQTTATEQTLPTVGAGGWGTINGYFLATAPSGGKAVFYCNFDDATPIVSGVNDVIKVTPTFRMLG